MGEKDTTDDRIMMISDDGGRKERQGKGTGGQHLSCPELPKNKCEQNNGKMLILKIG